MASTDHPRRLAFVISDLNTWGGQERCTLEVLRRLSRRWPIDVYAYTFDHAMAPEDANRIAFHRIRPHIRGPQLLRLGYFHAATWLLLRGGRRHLAQSALVHAAGACSAVSDVVQVHFVHAAWEALRSKLPAELRERSRIRHGGGLRNAALKIYYKTLVAFNLLLERRALTPEKSYLAVSRRVAGELKEFLGIDHDVRVVHHGVDASEFHPVDDLTRGERQRLRQDLGIGSTEVLVLFVGAYDRKGLTTVIEGMSLTRPETQQKMRLVAIGGGDQEKYRRLASQKGISDRVILIGHQQRIAAYYRAADLFVFPTLYEPFGMVILEAMACGLAPVVSSLAGASELIEDGVSGLLLGNPADPDEVRSALERLVTDDSARLSMGEQARRIAAHRTWDLVAEEYARALEPSFEMRPRPPSRGREENPEL